MRLLECKNKNEFGLTEDLVGNIPVYVILSHTWGKDDEEVTFKDMNEGSEKSKAGYRKIHFCGEQAACNGYRYFWVDTCCIDKSNPVELQHAINSMFRWYQNAARCYVYLSDVHSTEVEKVPQVAWHAAFQKSRWFTRGWTLQELLAPSTVEFFTEEYTRIGDKQSLEQQIHDITGIPIKALQGSPLSNFTIDERMSWVQNRETKYEEDKVYSLQGIFDTHIPLLYGEGLKRAMIRLQKEIQESTEVPAILSKRGMSWIVPFNRNPNFTGRESLLTELEGKLFVRGQSTKYAITGLGGVGKTQLVLELVYRIKEKHKNCSVIWIPATNMENLHQAYLKTAQQLDIPGWEDDKHVKKLVQDYLSKESTGRWLLIFDNADDINMWITKPRSETESSRLIDYLPRSEHGCVVFTSRDRKTAVKLAHNNVIEVPEMNEDVAIKLLQKCLINTDLVRNGPDTKALLKELTYLPLAIIQAVAYINENDITFSDYRSLLAEQEEDVIDLLSEAFEDDGRYHDIKNPVATTWLISFEQIRNRDPLAIDYLSFMACIDPKGIPQPLLSISTSRKKDVEAIGTLKAYSFISKRPADLALDLHRLVHLAIRNWLRKEGLITHWTEKTISRLEEVFPDTDHRNQSVWRMYLPHVRYALISDVIDKDSATRIELVRRFGLCLYNDGLYDEADAQLIDVFHRTERMLGAEHPSTLANMNNLAVNYTQQGRWKEAEDIQILLLELNEKVLSAKHPSTLTNMNNLAYNYTQQGRWKEAENIHILLLELNEKVLSVEHPSTLLNMNNLAVNYTQQGRWKEAEDIQISLLELNEKVLSVKHPSTLLNMNNLAVNYTQQGRWKEAENIQISLLELNEKVLSVEHPSTLLNMNNLAHNYTQQGRWKEAEDIQISLLELNEKVLSTEHPSTLLNMNNLAANYLQQGRWKEAENIQTSLLKLNEKVLGTEHPSTLLNMNNLALNYTQQGRWKEAEDIQTSLLKLNEKVLNAEHPSTLQNMNNLTLNYMQQGRWKEAEDIQILLLELNEKVLSAKHPSTLTNMNNLAYNYTQQGRWKEAEDIHILLLELNEKALSVEHPSTLANINNLAFNYLEQGRWKEAEELEVQVMETSLRVLGQEHPSTLTTMNNLAFAWKETGRETEAIRLMEECIQLQNCVLGPDHPDTLSSCTALAIWKVG